jgi:rhodanese-related sulfurtransferase
MTAQIQYYEKKLEFEMDPADLFEGLNKGNNIVVVDARTASGFEAEHIPGAINLPHREMTEASTRHLDKGALYVVYCSGIGCNGSTKGSLNLTKLGFAVRELIGGIEWWKLDGYATEGTRAAEGLAVQCAC